jgi:trehalose synthase
MPQARNEWREESEETTMTGDSGPRRTLGHVPLEVLSLERFRDVLEPAQWRAVSEGIERAGGVLAGRTVWNVNSTAYGGGVAEMLHSLLGYARGAGVDARWVTVGGDPSFFEVTKRLHNRLHGSTGDGGPLGEAERASYEASLSDYASALLELVSSEDLVILHDPQTAGLIPLLRESGARIAWRSHVGYDGPSELALEAWRFLLPYTEQADVCIFSRPGYAWGGLAPERLAFIHPSIDVFSVKNQELDADTVRAILGASGIIEQAGPEPASFTRANGRLGNVERRVALVEEARLPEQTPLVLQVSRWDRLKDPLGVLEGFVRHVLADSQAHLMLAGPATEGVADDPEGPEVLEEVKRAWSQLEPTARARVHLACIPMDDPDENAAIVNALQRHASVVCQKSVAEGFGLTVAEAMWKSRPVVATSVGGIQDQIVDGESGLLIGDPHDLPAFGGAVSSLLERSADATRLGAEAHSRARERFLGPEHLLEYLALFERLLVEPAAQPS